MSKLLDLTGLSHFLIKIKAWVTSQLTNYIQSSQKGASNGVATLDNDGKIPLSQLNDALLGNVSYQGTWNASTGKDGDGIDLPAPSIDNMGFYWITTIAGSFQGVEYEVGDWIISHGDRYDKVDNTDAVILVNGKKGNVVLTKSDIGLGNVDNTSDANKPISTAMQTALNNKQDKSPGDNILYGLKNGNLDIISSITNAEIDALFA